MAECTMKGASKTGYLKEYACVGKCMQRFTHYFFTRRRHRFQIMKEELMPSIDSEDSLEMVKMLWWMCFYAGKFLSG